MVHDTKKFWTMAPQPTCKHLGVGASCTIKLRFLHPKNHVKDKIPNQTSSQQLTGLIVQSKVENIIRKVNKDCIVFRHEDFSRQLDWVSVISKSTYKVQSSLILKKKPRSRLHLLGRAPINATSPHKPLILQISKMHQTPSLTTLKSFICSFRTCWTWVGTTLTTMTSLV